MALGGIYQEGTITISTGGILVVGVGTAFDLNKIEIGDWLFIGGQTGLIAEVTNDTHLSLETAWVGTLPSASPYIILKMSWLRYDPALTQAKLRQLLAELEAQGTFVFTDVAPPDPSLGTDGQWALQTNVTPWRMWYHTGGVWVEQASPGGGIAWKGAYSNTTDYTLSNAVSYNGSSYVSKADPPVGTLPTNATYWDLLAAKGDTGPPGPPGNIALPVPIASGGTAATTATAARDSLGTRKWFNAKTDYGAIGNGVADDHTAINACLSAAIAANGVAYFPTGTYRGELSGTTTGRIAILGDGPGRTLFRARTAGAICITMNLTNADSQSLHAAQFTIDDATGASSGTGAIGMQLTHANGALLDRISFGRGARGLDYGLNTSLSPALILNECKFTGINGYGVRLVADYTAQFNKFRDCLFLDCGILLGGGGVTIGSAAGQGALNSIDFEGCDFGACHHGIEFRETVAMRITNCNFETPDTTGQHLRSISGQLKNTALCVTGCTFNASPIGVGGIGNQTLSQLDKAIFTGNAFLNTNLTFDGTCTLVTCSPNEQYLWQTTITNPANVGQINFPATQNPSTDVNTLDDYKEGTWTPVLNGFTVTGTPNTSGRYTKIGNRVFWSYDIFSSGGTIASSAGNSYVTGLPYAPLVGGPFISIDNGGTISGIGFINITPWIFPPSWAASANHFYGNGSFGV